MDDTRQYRIYPNDLDLLAAYRCLYDHLVQCGYMEEVNAGCNEIEFKLRLSEERTLRTRTSEEFLRLLAQNTNPEETWTHCHWTKNDADLAITVSVDRSRVYVTVRAHDLTIIAGLHDKVREVFQARNPQKEHRGPRRYDLRPTIFLAHRFDEQGGSYAEKISCFLRRLGYDVVEGEGYEARNIPDKVADRIKGQDIFVCVVSEGDPTWLLSETAFAKGLSKFIIILVQENLPFSKGIVGGDYEHLTFPRGFIEKSYADLLYVLPRK
jgi:hypothetical protein